MLINSTQDRFIGQFDCRDFRCAFRLFPGEPQLPAPTLGQHNAEILRDYLGSSQQRIERLETEGILYRGER